MVLLYRRWIYGYVHLLHHFQRALVGRWLNALRPDYSSIEDGYFFTGEIAFSEIHLNTIVADSLTSEEQRYLSRHEIGHALGLRHTYEGEAEVSTVALMHPKIDNPNHRDALQSYDYEELHKTFPQ